MKAHTYRLQELTNVTTCSHLFKHYFSIRAEIERMLNKVNGNGHTTHNGQFHPDVFLGYCSKNREYEPLNIPAGITMADVYGF